jgi:hypothetical protein
MLFHRIRGILTLFALIGILREHLAIDRGNAEHVPNGVTEDRIGHTNDIEVNVWSIELGELARVDIRIPSRETFSDHDVSSLCYRGDLPARLFIPVPYEISSGRCGLARVHRRQVCRNEGEATSFFPA